MGRVTRALVALLAIIGLLAPSMAPAHLYPSGMGPLRDRLRYVSAGPRTVTRLAHSILGAGYGAGTTSTSASGGTVSQSYTYTNLSGKPITVASLVFQGWYVCTTANTASCTAGWLPTGNDVAYTATVSYAGNVVGAFTSGGGASSTIVSVNGGETKSDAVTLTTPIPAAASFTVNLAATLTAGQKYITTAAASNVGSGSFGFAGLLTTTTTDGLTRIAVAATGDSILTNGAIAYAAGNANGVPVYQASISGTQAATYGANGAANYARQTALFAMQGITDVVDNFSANDLEPAGRTAATIASYLFAMRDRVHAVGIRFNQTTATPRTNSVAAAVPTSITSAGTTMTLAVPDSTLFEPGKFYTLTGAAQAEYNGTFSCLSSGGGTVQLLFLGTATATATTSTAFALKGFNTTTYAAWMRPYSATYAAGDSSTRGALNAIIRTPGSFDSYIDWADATEPTRDAGRWVVGGETTALGQVSPILAATATTVKTVVVASTRMTVNQSPGSSTVATSGLLQFTSGTAGNVGAVRGIGSGNGNDLTISAAPTGFAIGDGVLVLPSNVAQAASDGQHPSDTQGGYGGKSMLTYSLAAWLLARK